jgi:hypothetical protein
MHWSGINYEQLFNLQEDPLEFVDVWNRSDYKGVLEEMRERHNELQLKVMEPCKPKTECDPFLAENQKILEESQTIA